MYHGSWKYHRVCAVWYSGFIRIKLKITRNIVKIQEIGKARKRISREGDRLKTVQIQRIRKAQVPTIVRIAGNRE